MQPQLGRLTGSAGGQSNYLHGGAIATGAPAPLTGTAKLISVLPSILATGASFIPGVGTLAAGGLGAIGEAARQDLSGENTDFGKIATQAGLSAIPGGLGKAAQLAKAANGINITREGLQTADAAGQVANAAKSGSKLSSALSDVAQTGAAKTSMAGKADQAANAILASQYGAIPAPVARSTDLFGTVGKLKAVGITAPQDAERVAGGITGANGILTKAVTKAAGGAGIVKTDGLQGIVDDAIQNHGLVGNDAKSVQSIVKGQLTKLTGGPNATVSGNANPNDALGVMKSLEARIADLKGQGGNYKLTDPTRLDKASVLQGLHNEIQDRLYTSAGANNNLSKVLTPELRDSLVALHPTSPQWTKYVDGTIMQSKDVGVLRSVAAPFVNISKVINAAATNAGTVGGKVANGILSGPGSITKGIAKAALTSGPVTRGAAAVLKGAAKAGNVTAGAGKVAGRLALGTAVPVYSAATSPSQTPQNDQNAASQLPTPPTGQPDATGAQDATSGQFSPSVLQAMALHDIQTTGGKNLAKIQALNSMFGPVAMAKDNKPQLSANQQKMSDAVQNAAGSVATLMQQFKQAGGASLGNAAEANIPLLGSRLQPNLAAYNSTRYDAASALAAATVGGKPTSSSITYWENSLPKATDSPAAAQQKINNVMQQLQQRGKIYGLDPSQLVIQ